MVWRLTVAGRRRWGGAGQGALAGLAHPVVVAVVLGAAGVPQAVAGPVAHSSGGGGSCGRKGRVACERGIEHAFSGTQAPGMAALLFTAILCCLAVTSLLLQL